jgi:hypothetical protein
VKTKVFFRIASILLLLFSAGHTLGFRKTDPSWGVDGLLNLMRSIHFDAQGFQRTYWDFYVGFGLFISVLFVFASLVCWQLSSLEPTMLRSLPLICWPLALCFVVVTILSWQYFFLVPIIFSLLISVCLILAAWFARGPA